MGSQLGLLSSGYDQLACSIASIVSLGTAAMFVRDTGNAQLLDTRLQGLTGSAQEYNAVQNYLFATADRLNTKYTTLTTSYAKLLNLQESGLLTAKWRYKKYSKAMQMPLLKQVQAQCN